MNTTQLLPPRPTIQLRRFLYPFNQSVQLVRPMACLTFRLESLEDDDPWIVEQKTFNILEEYLQPHSKTSPKKAACSIDNLTPMKRPDQEDGKEMEHPESFMWETWGTFEKIAKQIPSNHPSMERLAQLVKSLSLLPPTTVTIWTVSGLID